MKILFLTMSSILTLEQRGIYTDLLNEFVNRGHEVYIVSPVERRLRLPTKVREFKRAKILNIKTLNLTKSSLLEKGLGQLLVEKQYLRGIKKYFGYTRFDLVLYSTPPITFSKVIKYIKMRDGAFAYLLLKDIFPQNAVDMKMIRANGIIHRYFRAKEKELYKLSDTIGCMSPANVEYILKHNPEITQEKVEVNPNSIAPKPLNLSTTEKNEIRRKYNIPLDKTVFMYGGNFGKPQGLEFLLQCIQDCKEKCAFFVLIGDGTEYNLVEKWFSKHQPENALLIRRLPKEEYDVLLASCDVGLISLHKNFTIPNFPSRLLSYLEMKKPILAITDNASDIGSIITHTQCGYWVPFGNLNEALEMVKILCNMDLSYIGENSWMLLEREYLVNKSVTLIEANLNQK